MHFWSYCEWLIIACYSKEEKKLVIFDKCNKLPFRNCICQKTWFCFGFVTFTYDQIHSKWIHWSPILQSHLIQFYLKMSQNECQNIMDSTLSGTISKTNGVVYIPWESLKLTVSSPFPTSVSGSLKCETEWKIMLWVEFAL